MTQEVNGAQLVIEQTKKGGVYHIHNGKQLGAADMTLCQFPHPAIIAEMWERHCPRMKVEILDPIVMPTLGFRIEVSGPPLPHQQQSFVDELQSACAVVSFAPIVTVTVQSSTTPASLRSG